MKTFTLALASVLLLQSPSFAQDITGDLRLISRGTEESNGQCYGTGGFGDLAGELGVTIKDGSGKILAVGKTAKGRRPTMAEVEKPEYIENECVWDFAIKDVPKSDFYTVAIGRRGAIDYSYDEMVKAKWRVQFYLAK